MSEEKPKVLVVGDSPELREAAKALEASGLQVVPDVPAEPAAPETKVEEPPTRLRTRDDCVVYLNHCQREMLLDSARRWEEMAKTAEVEADRVEFQLVAKTARERAFGLLAENKALMEGKSQSGPVVHVAGTRLPRTGKHRGGRR